MVSVAILGNGVVGSGVVELIEKNAKESNEHHINISKILVKDKSKHKNSKVYELITDNINDVVKEHANIVVETIGGIYPAYDYVKKFLQNKTHVVTANKDLISKYGEELLKIAKENNVKLYFEASVGGGIPILRPIKECLVGNKIKSIKAILNGTTNFILTKMDKEQISFSDALSIAQDLGFAEFDPSSDIKGYDSARKLAILSNLAYNKKFDWQNFKVEGIEHIDEYDIKISNKLNGAIKLVGLSEEYGKNMNSSVRPAVISKDSILGKVEDEFNSIVIEGDSIGELAFYGKGAGRLPTASAVYADIMNIINNKKEKNLLFNNEKAIIDSNFPHKKDWIVRIKTKDRCKTICNISNLFKKVYIDSDINFPKEEIFALVYGEKEIDLKNKLEKIPNVEKLKTIIIL